MLTQMPTDNSNPQQGAYQPRRGPPNRRDERKLFVGGLPANITSDEFQEFFEQFGQLVDSVVMFDRETQRSRGFGFVTFEDPNVCRRILMMGNESADPSTAMSLVGKIEMQGKLCEVKAATPREGTRDRREDAKKMPLYHPNPAAAVLTGPPPTPHPVMYGYPVIGYPANIPPHTMYYPPAPYMEYAPPNGYEGFMEYPPPVEPHTATNPSGASMIPAVQPPYPIGVPPQPLLPAVLAVPQPQFVAGGIPAPPPPQLVPPSSAPSSDVPLPMPYIGFPVTAYGMPAAAAAAAVAAPGMEHHAFHYWNGAPPPPLPQPNSETV